MDSIAVDLRLVDNVTMPGKRAAAALRSVEKSGKGAAQSLDFSKEIARTEAALKKLTADPKGFVALKKAQNELKESRDKLLEHAGLKKPESFAAGLMSKFSFARMASAAAVGELMSEGVLKVAETLVEGAKAAVEVLTDGLKDAFKAAAGEQVQRVGERNVLGIEGSREFREDAERFAKLTPFNNSQIRKLMMPLRRAGLSQAASRQAFATAVDIGGNDEGAVSGVLEQFKRVYTRKGVGKKQLIELLGDVGTTIPDFYKALGKQMHVSAKEAEKRAANGQADPQLIMNMITQAQNKRQGGIAGTGGKSFADTMEVRWKKITELPDEFYKKFVDSPSFQRANDALGKFLEQLDPESPTGQRIMASLDKMFGRIGDLLSNPDELIDGLVDGIENAIGLFEQILPSVKDLGYGLAAAAEEMANLVTGARIFFAIQNGHADEAGKIMQEQVAAKQQRMADRFREQNERREKQTQQNATLAANFASGGLLGLMNAPAPQARHGKVVHVTVHAPIHVEHKGDESTMHGAHEAGEKFKQTISDAAAQAAQHAGN